MAKKNATAYWVIELRCVCPHCSEYVDLLAENIPDDVIAWEESVTEHRCPSCGNVVVASKTLGQMPYAVSGAVQ